MKYTRRARIVATLGPASATPEQIRALALAGADVFRLNFSHGEHHEHGERIACIRALEKELGRMIGILLDLQGPKLRVGRFADGSVNLQAGACFTLDLDTAPGTAERVNLPHAEIFAALRQGAELLLDDGKLRLRVEQCGADFARTTVLEGGVLSDRKGVNVPGVVLPLSALTQKDRADLQYGLSQGVDWVALSFVQRPQDVVEARALIGGQAWLMAKLEKPAAIAHLDEIIALSDGVMVARGDLGVELPAQQVPVLQRRIVGAARMAGRPVVVATQMLESMIHAATPTRAEASDVATAIYAGADAVMLSAESAVGEYACEAVTMMDNIIREVEADPAWRETLDSTPVPAQRSAPDAISSAVRQVTDLLQPVATVAYTSSGFSSLRASRERPAVPILALTPHLAIARRLALVWGVHPVPFEAIHDIGGMVEHAARAARTYQYGEAGDRVVVIAGLPFGRSGSTNLLHIAEIGDAP